MGRVLRTMAFFITWGLIFGTIMGGLSGTLILPLLGTAYALAWGAGLGLALGILTGGLAAFSDRTFRREKMNTQRYRRKLSAGLGVITSISTVLLLVATTRGFLWGPDSYDLDMFLLLSAIPGAIWGGLASAYTTTRHVDRSTGSVMPDARIDSASVIWRVMAAGVHRWTFIFGIAAGILYNVYAASRSYNPPAGFSGYLPIIARSGADGFAMTLANLFLLGIVNGCLLLFVNRLYFKEYAPHLTREQYKFRVTVLCFLATLGASLLVSLVVFAPLSALIAAMAVRQYADWLYADQDKFKRKAKTDYARLETADTLVEDVPAADVVETAVRQR